jgi:uncharacterized protein
MIPTKRNQKGMPTKEVHGGFPVHWLYTAGDVNEKFFYGLKDQKLIANTCETCNYTYLPPRMFCEDCFDELGESTYKELPLSGELVSFTEVYKDHKGKPLSQPEVIGLVKVDGSNSVFYHKLINTSNPSVGMKVKPVWSDNREGSLFDLTGFESQ